MGAAVVAGFSDGWPGSREGGWLIGATRLSECSRWNDFFRDFDLCNMSEPVLPLALPDLSAPGMVLPRFSGALDAAQGSGAFATAALPSSNLTLCH